MPDVYSILESLDNIKLILNLIKNIRLSQGLYK